MLKLIVIVSIVIIGINALVLPEELVSLLNIAYSNIPVIKKGTDSRLGWGFRLGNRLEIQMLWEFGPQTYTRPLGVQSDNNSNDRKRNVADNLIDMQSGQKKRKSIKMAIGEEQRGGRRMIQNPETENDIKPLNQSDQDKLRNYSNKTRG